MCLYYCPHALQAFATLAIGISFSISIISTLSISTRDGAVPKTMKLRRNLLPNQSPLSRLPPSSLPSLFRHPFATTAPLTTYLLVLFIREHLGPRFLEHSLLVTRIVICLSASHQTPVKSLPTPRHPSSIKVRHDHCIKYSSIYISQQRHPLPPFTAGNNSTPPLRSLCHIAAPCGHHVGPKHSFPFLDVPYFRPCSTCFHTILPMRSEASCLAVASPTKVGTQNNTPSLHELEHVFIETPRKRTPTFTFIYDLDTYSFLLLSF